jgi:hypothetical protein
MAYARVVILLRLYSFEQCLDPVFRTSIKTRNFVTFYKFLIHLGVHHTMDGPRYHLPTPHEAHNPLVLPSP